MSTIAVSNIKNASATNTAIVLDTAGTVQAYSTISVGNATPSSSGAGITFPAAVSASSNANTLDDYEEGTFTPTIIGSTSAGTGTYAGGGQVGTYTKIGRLVNVSIYLEWTAHTGTGNMYISGLPFTPASETAGSIGLINNITLSANNVPFVMTALDGTIRFWQSPVAGGGGAYVSIDTSAWVYVSANYTV
jgi:hypothetical protein